MENNINQEETEYSAFDNDFETNVTKFNSDADLIKQGIYVYRTFRLIGEELLELFGFTKEEINEFLNLIISEIIKRKGKDYAPPINVFFDCLEDIKVFANGEEAKGLYPICKNNEEIVENIKYFQSVVMNANFTKLKNKTTNEHGKLMKPVDFVPPDNLIKERLDKLVEINGVKDGY